MLVVVCGLKAEADIARSPHARVLAGGGDQARLAADLREAVAGGCRGALSFGIAGGLALGLRAGDVRVADAVVLPSGARLAADPGWAAMLARRLGAPVATMAGVDAPLVDVAGKAALHALTGADTVDMETHVTARAASEARLPWAAVRVVTDAAERALPHAAGVGMRADGTVDLPAVLRSLARRPGQLPGLIRTGLDARAAFAALFRCRQHLGPGFAFLDLGEPLLNVT